MALGLTACAPQPGGDVSPDVTAAAQSSVGDGQRAAPVTSREVLPLITRSEPDETAVAEPSGDGSGEEPDPAEEEQSSEASPTPSALPAGESAERDESELAVSSALATLPIKGRAPKTGYVRSEVFGHAWKDVDRNGCDTRNDILGRDLLVDSYKPGTRECVVLTGTLRDPYTGTVIDFVRGQSTSQAVQIDHVVALSDAWQKGAQSLTQDEREAFANDPLNLLAVDGPSNSRKSDGDAATWLPPVKAFRCSYVARQTAVKVKYGLWVTQAEHDAIARVIAKCPGEKIPEA